MTVHAETSPYDSPAVILGETISVGLRTYLEITSITGPSEANYGDTVTLNAYVRNVWTEDILYAVATARIDDIEVVPPYDRINAGETRVWPLTFTMPNKSVIATIFAMYWGADDEWHEDDRKAVSVALKVPLAGTIVREELEYDGVQDPIPVRDIPQGQRALVHIWGRNDTSVNQKLALSWAIRAPDGVIVEQDSDWETWHTGPGGQHHFIIPPGALDYLSLNKVGTYTIGVALVMNPDNPTIVDEYAGDLCTVVAVAPPVFEGTITRVALEYDGEMTDAPVADVPLDSKSLIHVWGRNDTAENRKLGLSWVVKDPDGLVIELNSDWETWHTGPGGQHHFIIPPGALDYLNLNKQGQYTLNAELLMNPDSPVVVDTYAGIICTVAAAPVFKGTITKKELEYDGKQTPIPVANVLVGLHGLVHIWGRNDMATNEQLGLSWVIKDPDEIVVEQGTDWSTLAYLPGREHHFILPPGVLEYVDFDKLGTYTMSIELLMNPADPVVVASYDGTLCTTTMEIPPDYELIQDTVYPHAYIYDGEAEIGVATFSLPVGPPPIVDWLGAKIINSFADKVEEEGSRMLELKVYRWTTVPWVNYRLEATAAVAPEGGGIATGIAIWPVLALLPWKAIITAAIIAAIMIIVTNLVILPVLRIFFERKPGLSEPVKKLWSREHIIGIIIDMRPAYSPEELGAMSDQELRDVLNEVYAEEVPPVGIPWWGWAIIGGVGIAGGALVYRFISPLLPKKKKKE